LFKLEISDAQVDRLLYIIDEDKNGIINISEYYNALEAYNCRGEVIGPFDDDPSNIKFEHQSLFRMVKILRERKVTFDELFIEADTSGDGIIDLLELKVFLDNLGGFQEKELHSLKNYLDIDKDGSIEKKEWDI